MNPTTTLKTISPKMASDWLQSDINRENRRLRPHHVNDLAREMAAGRWISTHQGIAFAKSGRLLDGQHRLAAIIQAGVSVRMMVTEDLDEQAFKVMDRGLKRAHHELLHLVENADENHLICQAIRHYLTETTVNRRPSPGDIEDEFLGQKFVAWVWVGKEVARLPRNLRNAGVYAALAVYYYVNPEKAKAFMEGYRTGAGLDAMSPVLNLRNRVLGCANSSDCDYWFCVSLTRAHLNNATLRNVYEASEDMLGAKNTSRAVMERAEVHRRTALAMVGKRGPGRPRKDEVPVR